jgi:hypothetical protein
VKIDIDLSRGEPEFHAAVFRNLKCILASLAVMVVCVAQVMGMHLGFVCEHQGRQVETFNEHCHQVSEFEKTGFLSCSGDGHLDEGGQKDVDHHVPLKASLLAGIAGLASVSIPTFVAVLVGENLIFKSEPIRILNFGKIMKARVLARVEIPPRAAVQSARCVVILV